ncbi:DNA mismatch repair endonuclease MutL [Enterobacteriaceae bacterium H11S18]|uniref:DNA mismatch repair endonuclease MutL n=1 Tax=Dryocola clanedunensis TaxID=2925396 RepID=UPI0022F006AF|nr:DNA mismatch repair endonuclease MutL [Dryocola clanedunensis]MCT4709620.1 DNA mismatch repair endonuclease MutL [Dryocola clanedunensis]
MPIQVLPPQLANQIAAGEVVERPASVVKELIENSLDAGATRIDIDIERGGAKMIRIRDNGCGIKKDELALALARHATSKIACLDDLEAIISLGFRGEALASISSVARLTLTSRTEEQSEAWQAYAEGRDQAVTVKPAAHPVGTTLEVLDLFYNTPARRKFMRTEKTEFNHIDEIVRRIALARFDVSINLNHNGKMVRQYRAVQEGAPRTKRLGAICGTQFLEQALEIEWQHGDLALRGWVAEPSGTTSALAEIQYCYVNGRMMRDRLITHAIRQACEDKLGSEQPAFVLYLEIDPHQVDVNVHPAKHEVRFHQSRLVHDFIYQGVLSVLQQQSENQLLQEETSAEATQERWQPENRVASGRNQFSTPAPASGTARDSTPRASGGAQRQPLWPNAGPGYQKQQGALYRELLDTPTAPPAANRAEEPSALEGHSQSFGRVLTVIQPEYALLEREGKLMLLSLSVADRWLKQAQLIPGSEGVRAQPLLIPVRMKVSKEELEVLLRYQPLLLNMGVEFAAEAKQIVIRTVPLPLRKQNLQILIHELPGYLAQQAEIDATQIAHWFARHLTSEHEQWNQAQAIALLADVERLCPQLVRNPPGGLLQPVDLTLAMNALKDD